MDRGHREAYGSTSQSDPEHLQAQKCMRPLLYATSIPAAATTDTVTNADEAPDTILVLDVDRSCVPKKLKGDHALTQLAGTLLNLPGMSPLVPQTWFQGGGGRRIHSGMAASMVSLPASGGRAAREVPSYIAAAAFEQKAHWILVAHLNGTRDDGMHAAFPYTSVSFEDGKPVILYPFLLGKMNVVK